MQDGFAFAQGRHGVDRRHDVDQHRLGRETMRATASRLAAVDCRIPESRAITPSKLGIAAAGGRQSTW